MLATYLRVLRYRHNLQFAAVQLLRKWSAKNGKRFEAAVAVAGKAIAVWKGTVPLEYSRR